MQYAAETVVYSWLSKLSLPVSPGLINRQLKSHPDYPSLLSITDTLEHLGIEHAAVQIEKDQVHEVSTPFVAHLQTNGGEFVIVQNRDTLEKVYPGFFEQWSGVVLVAEKDPLWQHKENEEWLQKERKKVTERNSGITLIFFFVLASLFLTPGWITGALTMIAIAGIFISWLIISKELGIENKIADRVCGDPEGCKPAIRSNTIKLPFGISWSDIGMAWFTSLFTVLVLSAFAGNTAGVLNILSLLSVAAVLFIFFSVYYQLRIAKKWCRLCLIIAGLLLLQGIVLLTPLQNYLWQAIKISDVFFTASSLLLVTIAWLLIKKLLLQNKDAVVETLNGIRFKRNEIIFKSLFERQRITDTVPWENDLQLSNAAAPLQITVACNPYCAPCAKTHEKLHNLLRWHGGKIGLTIRFTVSTINIENKTTKVVQHILQHVEQFTAGMEAGDRANYTREVLHQWFKLMDHKMFIEKYPCTGQINVDDLLNRYKEWTAKSNITFTPTIFVNGREMPAQYNVDDIPWLINAFAESFPIKEELKTELN